MANSYQHGAFGLLGDSVAHLVGELSCGVGLYRVEDLISVAVQKLYNDL